MKTHLAHLEIHWGGRWRLAGRIEAFGDGSPNQGHLGSTWLEYDPLYLADCFDAGVVTGATALSVRSPAQPESDGQQPHWPPFMLDILPSGHARRFWLGRVDLAKDLNLGAPSDWPLLLAGGCNPPGNIRVREAAAQLAPTKFYSGFSYEDVVGKQQEFIEFADHAGVPVAGSSGAPGDAPKYLLVRDRRHRWHPDGVIPDQEIFLVPMRRMGMPS